MSLARIYHTSKTRKPWVCSSCKVDLPVGSECLTFAVGFRGRDQRRCMKPGCYPTPSQRESSAVASVYAAQEEFDVSDCDNLEDIQAAVEAVVSVIQEVASDYESSEMYDINEDLQERVSTLESAAEDLEGWESNLNGDEPEQDHEEFALESGEINLDAFNEAHETWLAEARDAATEAVNSLELP